MTNTTNCTNSAIYTYEQALSDENLPLNNVALSDGIVAVNLFKLYREGEYTASFLTPGSISLINFSGNGTLYKCGLNIRESVLVNYGVFNSQDNEVLPFHNIILVRLNEEVYDNTPTVIKDSLNCLPYNGDISTLPYFPEDNLSFNFVRNILLNSTEVGQIPIPCPTTTVIMPTTTLNATIPNTNSVNNSINIITIVGGVLVSAFAIIVSAIAAVFLFKLDQNIFLKIKTKIGKIFRVKNNINADNMESTKIKV